MCQPGSLRMTAATVAALLREGKELPKGVIIVDRTIDVNVGPHYAGRNPNGQSHER